MLTYTVILLVNLVSAQQQRDDDVVGGSYCQKVPVVVNGRLSCPYRLSGHRRVILRGQACRLSCNNGYTPTQGNDQITCAGHETWTGHAVCTDKHCPAPATVAGGTFVCPPSRVFGSTCRLYCSAGHMVRGPAQITCLTNNQWSTLGSCTKVQCPSPPVVFHGSYTCPTRAFTHGETCQLQCNPGFRAVTSQLRITCQADETWSPASSCVALKCPSPPAIENGKYRCPDASYTHGETCRLECNKGFHAATHHFNITCQADETWSAATSCIEGCPQGTFTNITSSGDKFCQMCSKGSYQGLEGSVICIPCPGGWTTLREGSKDVSDCTSMCRPGTVSSTGLEPCHLCPLGSYQNQTGGNTCEPCPGGHTTTNVGSSLTEHCVPL